MYVRTNPSLKNSNGEGAVLNALDWCLTKPRNMPKKRSASYRNFYFHIFSPPMDTCAACRKTAAKYTCPYCRAKTCSLPCFQEHKDASSSCIAARKEHEQASLHGPPTSILSRERGPTSRFVPMNKYDYNQLIQDYQFLNQVGRMVSSTGRALYDGKMLGTHIAGEQRRAPAAVQRREALAKQLSYHKLPIMLLPEGMSKRKINRTQWDTKNQRMLYTAHVSFPCASPNPLVQGWLFHRIEGGMDIVQSVLCQMERIQARLQDTRSADEAPASKRARTETLPEVWAMLGVPCTKSDRTGHLPTNGVLLLHVYEIRLRNESTSKFLDWWVRKGAALESVAPLSSTSTAPMVQPHALQAVSQLRPDKDTVAKSPLHSNTRQHYIRIMPGMTFESVLRSMPSAFGLVEYFDLEWWHMDALRDAEHKNQVNIMTIHTPAPPPTLVAYASDSE